MSEGARALADAANDAGWRLLCAPGRTDPDLRRAAECFREALRREPGHRCALSNLGDTLLALGEEDEAVATMEAASTAGQENAAAHNWLAWFFSQKRADFARALEHARRAVELSPAWGVARLNLAFAHERAGAADDAYRAYADALACGDAHDEAFAERKILETVAARARSGEAVPALLAGSPAHGRLAGVEEVARALAGHLSGAHGLAPGHTFFHSLGMPVPDGDVPFGWVGSVAGGRTFTHALVSDLGIFRTVEVLRRAPAGVVFRSLQVHGSDIGAAAEAVTEWLRPPPDPRAISPLDAAAVALSALCVALPGWRLRMTGGADYYAPDRPACAAVVQRRLPGSLGVSSEALAAGGVRVRLMHEAMRVEGAAIDVAGHEELIALLPRLTESSRQALAALESFRARPFPVRAAVDRVLSALRREQLTSGPWEPTVSDDGYPYNWPHASLRTRKDSLDRFVAGFTESADGCRVEIDGARWNAGTPGELDAALPEIVTRARGLLKSLTTEALVLGSRFRVIAPWPGFVAGDVVVLVEDVYDPHQGEHHWTFQSASHPGQRVRVSEADPSQTGFLGRLGTYLDALG